MQPIASDVSVCQPVTRLWYANVAERTSVLFGMETLGGPKNIVLDSGHNPPRRREEKVHSMQPLPNYFGLLFHFFHQ